MKRLYLDLGAALGMAVVLSLPALGQTPQAAPRTATIMGTVTDVNGDAIPNATVVLKEVKSNDPLTIVTTGNGMFEFHDVTPGIPYQLSISAKDFADWTSTPITLNSDQFKIVSGIQLRIATERTTVDVHYDPVGPTGSRVRHAVLSPFVCLLPIRHQNLARAKTVKIPREPDME